MMSSNNVQSHLLENRARKVLKAAFMSNFYYCIHLRVTRSKCVKRLIIEAMCGNDGQCVFLNEMSLPLSQMATDTYTMPLLVGCENRQMRCDGKANDIWEKGSQAFFSAHHHQLYRNLTTHALLTFKC
ncbi:CLUMA_CG007143, isoform A [Clunio marinus]|uniref:CLUMA_CG007143, isoform A n=1 Tax=Clunio marinus TaxID=568069 RepID=A0A1J1I013_9DIPT|nr:CLUMA_CG007143, isoform A [Clunio marinus]